MTTPAEGRQLLGQILKARGVLKESQIQQGLAEQRKSGGLIGQCLVELGLCTAADVAMGLAEQAGLETVDLESVSPDSAALDLVDASTAHAFGVLPLRVEGADLYQSYVVRARRSVGSRQGLGRSRGGAWRDRSGIPPTMG